MSSRIKIFISTMVLVMKNLKLGKIPAQVHFENTLKSSYSCIGNMSALLRNIARYYQQKCRSIMQ